jgi:hypothetical protein
MTNRLVPRPAALSGIAAVVLLFLGSGLSGGGSPDVTASRSELSSWLADQRLTTGRYAGVFIELLAILAMIVFAATLASVLRRGEDEHAILSNTAFGAGILSAAIKLASVPAAFAAQWRAKQGFSPELASALVDMNNAAFVLTWAVDAVMLGAAAIVILRSAILPRWLGWFAGATAVISLATVPVAAYVPPLGILLTFIWFLAVSIVLLRGRVREPRAAVATA